MIKKEYTKYVFSIFTVIIALGFVICVLGSYLSTFSGKIDLMAQLQNPALDIDIASLTEEINGYNGFTYLFHFFSSDFYLIFLFIVLAGLGVGIGATTWNSVNNGYGNLLVTRLGYRKYIREIMLTQILYISSLLTLLSVVQIIVTLIIFPVNPQQLTSAGILMEDDSFLRNLLFCISHLGLLIVYVISSIIPTSLLTYFAYNKYLLQAFPIIIYMIPFLIASTVGNLSPMLGQVLGVFVADSFIHLPYMYIVSELYISQFLLLALPLPLVMMAVIKVSYKYNIKVYEGSYL